MFCSFQRGRARGFIGCVFDDYFARRFGVLRSQLGGFVLGFAGCLFALGHRALGSKRRELVDRVCARRQHHGNGGKHAQQRPKTLAVNER